MSKQIVAVEIRFVSFGFGMLVLRDKIQDFFPCLENFLECSEGGEAEGLTEVAGWTDPRWQRG